jgi:predicted Rossmann fold nucleotide-binding protein DprA/Smf involved in DNA uptake
LVQAEQKVIYGKNIELTKNRKRSSIDASTADNSISESSKIASYSDAALESYVIFLQRFLDLSCNSPLNIKTIAAQLELDRKQVSAWLTRGVAEGKIKKLNNPVRYCSQSTKEQQASLFGYED